MHGIKDSIKKQLRQNRFLNPIVTTVGVLFLILAVIGAFIPFVPGILFLIIGIIILGEEFFLTRWILKKMPEKARKRLKKRRPDKGKDDEKRF